MPQSPYALSSFAKPIHTMLSKKISNLPREWPTNPKNPKQIVLENLKTTLESYDFIPLLLQAWKRKNQDELTFEENKLILVEYTKFASGMLVNFATAATLLSKAHPLVSLFMVFCPVFIERYGYSLESMTSNEYFSHTPFTFTSKVIEDSLDLNSLVNCASNLIRNTFDFAHSSLLLFAKPIAKKLLESADNEVNSPANSSLRLGG